MKKYILLVPFLIIVLVISALILFIGGLWKLGLLIIACSFLLNWCSETFALNFVSKTVKQTGFRVLTLNVNRAYDFSVNKGSTEELIEMILNQSADVILLQEYNINLYPEVNAKLSDVYPYDVFIDDYSRYKSAFSRYPITSVEQLTIDVNKYKSIFQDEYYCSKSNGGKEILPICKMTITINEHAIQIFNCHLMSNNFSVEIRKIRETGKGICKGIVSILRRIDFGYRCRETQMRVLNNNIVKDIPSIVCGDLNDIGGSPVVRILNKAGFCDAWWEVGYGYGATFHGMGLRFRLDHIFYSKHDLKPLRAKLIKTNVSDHYPLVADFVFVDN